MPGQVLKLVPDTELKFRGPFDRVVSTTMRLSNPAGTDRPVAFKVKTTAPKRYCVRPNSGLIQPGDEVEVAVMLQPAGSDQADFTADQRARHKFMVQSLLMPTGAVDVDEAWKSATSDRLMDSKLRVVLLDADGSVPAPAAATSTASANNKQHQQYDSADADSPKTLQGLQQELQRLKDDNARLGEQELRLRKLAMRPSVPTVGGSSANAVATATARGPLVPPALFLVLAMILGLILGKFLL